MTTVAGVVKDGLCVGCGTCAGICPFNAIDMRRSDSSGLYLPNISKEKCRSCSLCVKSCPGNAVDFEKLNLELFGKQPEDRFLGNYSKCYIGYSNDRETRYNSASGGLISQILIFALENGLIDAAAVTAMRKDKPLETEAIIARTRGEIISASKSKYCPVAVNEVLKQIREEDGRFAVVGLPCHIHGFRKAESIDPSLKKKIVLHIGLLCSHEVNFLGTEFILNRMHVKKEQVNELSYRGRGWPGSMTIKTSNNSVITLPLMRSWKGYWSIFSSFFFTPWRCIMCPDQAGELADISLGDAWLPELRSDKDGESIIVTRTVSADSLLSQMSSAKAISISETRPEKVKQSQKPNLIFKKNDFPARIELLRMLGKQTPTFNPAIEGKKTPLKLLKALYPCLSISASNNKYLKSLLVHAPAPFFRVYSALYRFHSSL